MKITIVYGQNHKGSTYHLARSLAEKIGGEITEFFLPKDFGEFCVGCTACFMDSETKCPHYARLSPITEAMDEADVIILASPVYVMHASGAMKAFLDHYGYRFMVHRPEEKMFSKQGVVISTAAGAGTKGANKDMADSLFWWGVGKVYKHGTAVFETSWDRVSEKKKLSEDEKLSALAGKIKARYGRVKPGIKTKLFFGVMRIMQKNGFNKADMDHWKAKGWTEKKRPWKKQSFMMIEIEYFQYDIFLFGKRRSRDVLLKELEEVERDHDKNEDNFTELLCKKYGWVMIDKAQNPESPEYTYDRDIGKLVEPRY